MTAVVVEVAACQPPEESSLVSHVTRFTIPSIQLHQRGDASFVVGEERRYVEQEGDHPYLSRLMRRLSDYSIFDAYVSKDHIDYHSGEPFAPQEVARIILNILRMNFPEDIFELVDVTDRV